ncbi:MAG: hypothetical protein ABIN13_04420 [Mucilaginibacter sp.]
MVNTTDSIITVPIIICLRFKATFQVSLQIVLIDFTDIQAQLKLALAKVVIAELFENLKIILN